MAHGDNHMQNRVVAPLRFLQRDVILRLAPRTWEQVFRLTNLEVLNASKNLLESVGNLIAQLANLTVLDLSVKPHPLWDAGLFVKLHRHGAVSPLACPPPPCTTVGVAACQTARSRCLPADLYRPPSNHSHPLSNRVPQAITT